MEEIRASLRRPDANYKLSVIALAAEFRISRHRKSLKPMRDAEGSRSMPGVQRPKTGRVFTAPLVTNAIAKHSAPQMYGDASFSAAVAKRVRLLSL
jgi:hypothetical protein